MFLCHPPGSECLLLLLVQEPLLRAFVLLGVQQAGGTGCSTTGQLIIQRDFGSSYERC